MAALLLPVVAALLLLSWASLRMMAAWWHVVSGLLHVWLQVLLDLAAVLLCPTLLQAVLVLHVARLLAALLLPVVAALLLLSWASLWMRAARWHVVSWLLHGWLQVLLDLAAVPLCPVPLQAVLVLHLARLLAALLLPVVVALLLLSWASLRRRAAQWHVVSGLVHWWLQM